MYANHFVTVTGVARNADSEKSRDFISATAEEDSRRMPAALSVWSSSTWHLGRWRIPEQSLPIIPFVSWPDRKERQNGEAPAGISEGMAVYGKEMIAMISVKELYRGLWEGYAFMPRKKNTAVSQFLPGKKGERVVERAFFYPALGAKRGRGAFRLDLSGPGQRASGKLQLLFVDDFVKDDPTGRADHRLQLPGSPDCSTAGTGL